MTPARAAALDDRERSRARIREALSVHYSLDEIREIGADMRREVERRQEVAEIFGELSNADAVEESLFQAYLWQLGRKRGIRRASKDLDPAGHRLRLHRERVAWRKWYRDLKTSNPSRYRELLARGRAAHKKWRSKPGQKQKIRAQQKRWEKANPARSNDIKRRWVAAHPERRREQANAYWKRIQANDPLRYRQKLDEHNRKRSRGIQRCSICGTRGHKRTTCSKIVEVRR